MKTFIFSTCILLVTMSYAQRSQVQKAPVAISLSEYMFKYPEYYAAIDSVIVDILQDRLADCYKYISVGFEVSRGRNAVMIVSAVDKFPFSKKEDIACYIPYKNYAIIVMTNGKDVVRMNPKGRLRSFTCNPNLPPFYYNDISWRITVHEGHVMRWRLPKG